jgi:hypothetical protein
MSDLMSTRSARMAQGVWLMLAVAATAADALAPAFQWSKLQTICRPDSVCASFQVDTVAARTLSQHGISMGAYAVYTVAVWAAVWVIWYGLATLIICRKPQDRGALLAAFFLVVLPVWGATTWLPSGALSNWLGAVFIAALLLFCLLFPDGRFAPRWTRWLVPAIVVLVATFSLPFDALQTGVGAAISAVTLVSIFLAVVGVQIYRFRSMSSWKQRQQTKWASFGLAVAMVGLVSTWTVLASAPFPTGNGTLFLALTNFSGIAALLTAIPISIAISVLRSRLWDIDRVISRALAYTALTVTLAGIYIGSVVGLQALFRAISGQQSELAIAVSTLVIAALFNPLRHRIQDVIARTFSRRKYNAQQVLAAFGVACRDETDLEKLRGDMMRVVEETVQPAHVSLWLRDSSRKV